MPLDGAPFGKTVNAVPAHARVDLRSDDRGSAEPASEREAIGGRLNGAERATVRFTMREPPASMVRFGSNYRHRSIDTVRTMLILRTVWAAPGPLMRLTIRPSSSQLSP
jgi:hypothetical protein